MFSFVDFLIKEYKKNVFTIYELNYNNRMIIQKN